MSMASWRRKHSVHRRVVSLCPLRIGIHWHYVSACQGKQCIRQAATEIVGWTRHIIEDESRRVSSCSPDITSVCQRLMDSIPTPSSQTGPVPPPLPMENCWIKGRIGLPMWKYCRPVKFQAWKHFSYKLQAQFRWAGHFVRMPDNRIPKQSAALNRSSWRSECHQAIEKFEQTRVATLERKRAAHKYGVQPGSHVGVWPCVRYSRICTSRIGLYAHQRSHRQSVDLDGAVHGCQTQKSSFVHINIYTNFPRILIN